VPRIKVTISPMTQIAAMIHGIVATPPPTVTCCDQEQIHVALPSDGADRLIPLNPDASV
jgi:hypothetical protein